MKKEQTRIRRSLLCRRGLALFKQGEEFKRLLPVAESWWVHGLLALHVSTCRSCQKKSVDDFFSRGARLALPKRPRT